MRTFREYEAKKFVDFVMENFDSPTPPNTAKQPSAKKDDILRIWKNLRPNVPIMITPVGRSGEYRSYGEDGIRINGSWNFIAAVLGRIKDLINYENQQTRLRLVFRGVDSSSGQQSYVFYLNLEERKKKEGGFDSPI